MTDRPEPAQAFVVGAQRCGTTSVTTALARHPQVDLAEPRNPEPKWFLVPGAADRVDEYLARYHPAPPPGTRLRLEKSTSYLGSDVACAEIARAFPGAAIVVVVRDPVARALSHYAFSVRSGVEDLPPEEALDPAREDRPWDEAAISVSPYHYLRRGRYVDDLARWDRAFGPEAVHVVVLEDLRAEPGRFADLVAALGLDPGSAFVPDERQNAGEHEIVLDAGTEARLRTWFADADAALADRLGRPLDRWSRD
jgi:hypothetical protein